MNNLDLLKQSYCISCKHINKLNEDYKNYNNTVFNKQFTCLKNKNKEDYNRGNNNRNNNYDNYNDKIQSSYITKKSCYDPSLNTIDNHIWDLLFIQLNNDLNNNLNITFNENTKRKIR